MVMVEALVCGTPVIGFPEGAEIVIDGVNGMLVNDGAEMARAVERLGRSTHETAVRASPSATTRRSPPPATSASTDERSTRSRTPHIVRDRAGAQTPPAPGVTSECKLMSNSASSTSTGQTEPQRRGGV